MKINNIKITLVGLTILVFAGCSEDFLTTSPYALQTNEVFFESQDELDAALMAAYKAVAANGYKSGAEFGWFAIGDIGSDDASRGGIESFDPPFVDITMSRQNSANYILANIWSGIYAAISRCNLVIDASSEVSGDEVAIQRISNEAKFLRALMYYGLVTYWGEVPLFTSYAYVNEAIRPKSTVEEIWAQIEQDFQDATELPKRSEYATDQIGRATSGAAWSMLGKALMYQKKYTEAASAFKNVIESDEYELVDDYGFIFRKEGNNCIESIFETQHMANTNAGAGGVMVLAQLPADPESGGWGYNAPTQDLVDEFEVGDPRTIYTVLFKGDTLPTATSDIWIVQNKDSNSGYQNRKALIPLIDKAAQNIFDLARNVKYLRYAEVLLLYAEALNETGQSAAALPYLNLVRERARNTPIDDPERIGTIFDLSYTGELLPDVTTTDQTELRKAIYHEQRVELAEEGHRREYLLRTGRFLERMNEAKNLSLTDEKWLVMPIPHDDILKSEGVLVQHPGY